MIKKLLHLYHRLVNFFIKGLWEQTAGASGRLLKGVAGRAILTGKIFLRERMQHRASALTYSTLLSVVPLLAIIFAIAKGFGLSAIIEQMMRENISASRNLSIRS